MYKKFFGGHDPVGSPGYAYIQYQTVLSLLQILSSNGNLRNTS